MPNRTTLTELRAGWEDPKYVETVCTIPRVEDGYPSVYAIVRNKRTSGYYSLHRYFAIGGDWCVSVDMEGQSLESCLRLLDDGMKELYQSILQTAGEVPLRV